MRSVSLALLALAGFVSAADYCYDKPSKVVNLPFWSTTDQLPCMYSGTLPANSKPGTNHNLFYWLFKSAKARPDAPLVLWLNGGPGSSSMFGLFVENGPLRVARNGTGTGDFIVSLPRDGQGSWIDEGVDMVFVDQPVGTGFSYGDSLATTMQ